MKTLPDKPSELIRFALSDLKKCEKEGYEINMDRGWYEKTESCCIVCLAGAVMVQSLQKPEWLASLRPTDFPNYRNNLLALNLFRMGNIAGAFHYLNLNYSIGHEFSRKITHYSLDRDKFVTDLMALAADLEKKGY